MAWLMILVREAFKKKTAYFVTLDQKVGGYLFQNIISFEEEIVTYV